MIIFPDIEIQDGHSVNRTRGKENQPDIYDIAPLEAARKFVDAGAEWLHVIDIDGSLQHGKPNSDLICEIIDSVDVPVQVGGGIRTQSDVDWWFDHGAARVVLGTAAVVDRLLTMNACGAHPGKIVISITGKSGYAMIDGWRTRTSFTALELAKSFEDSGAAAIIYTDLDRFEDGQAVGLASTIEIGTQLSIPLISTGTVTTLEDVSTLSLLPNIEGVIIGRALFQGSMDLVDAIDVARASSVAPEVAADGVAPKLEQVSGVPISHIDHVGIYSGDLDRSVQFYQMLGFAKEDTREDSHESEQETPLIMRHHSGVTLALFSAEDREQRRAHVALEVSSLAQSRALLEYNGIAIVDSHEDRAKNVIRIADPDQNLIELGHYR